MGREQVSELLVAAALRGQRQIKGLTRDEKGGLCAMGVLIDALPGEWHSIDRVHFKIGQYAADAYKITPTEIRRIVDMNDDGSDFLTIARKWENENA